MSGKVNWQGTLENIKDVSGYNRFIEGELTPLEISGITYTYAKWNLSGSHLMIVVAGTVDSNTIIPDNQAFVNFSIPNWMWRKIVPYNSYNAVSHVPFKVYTSSADSSEIFNVTLYRFSNNTIGLNNVSGQRTVVTGGAFRIQFDLLIDNVVI